MRWNRLLAGLWAVSLLPAVCFGQQQPPFNQAGVGYSNCALVISIAGFSTNDQKISGTKVEFTAKAEVTRTIPEWLILEPPPGGVEFTDGYVSEIRLKVGGQELLHLSGLSPETKSVQRAVRFSSTHFPHGSSVVIELYGKAILERNEGESSIVERTLRVLLSPYNTAIALGTVEEFLDQLDPPHFSKPGDPDYPGNPPYASMAALATQAIIPILTGQSMNHVMVEGNGTGTDWRESTGPARLDVRLSQATLMFACTHGSSTHWRSSKSDELYYFGLENEVATYVSTGFGEPRPPREVPEYNLAVFHACETLSTQSSNFNPKAFRLLPLAYPNPASVYQNKGYAGFANLVYYELIQPSGQTLDRHAATLFQFLASGHRLQHALNLTHGDDPDVETQPYWPRSRNAGTLMRMIVRGDPHTRLVNVYLSASEWLANASDRDSWFWILP
ncbi:MAG: hypothetical protein L6Q31_05355 [Fimbriimonadaceae bacterium]|uniref:Gingipain domain-containing protein n=1 Tax=Candidatus Nitrosymbiomonas proteolyticus TaxID=2608984 RepID=A0A809S5F3_9BACT|nr:hypothetical protein [Fimbriimonadaceae bacterium]NUM39958.1 hypothetical protein [Armatimonadota bacterium]BBO24207.1 conserved hypothetical protein [Candidatus Nitrosymbiomonas proteolyticus]